jgi:hypothetical protein
VTTHARTPDEPGTRRQADGPHVPAQRPGDKDTREIQDPDDLPFPLAELLETGRTREPEPDLEAEP